jgi:hypothetical protein
LVSLFSSTLATQTNVSALDAKVSHFHSGGDSASQQSWLSKPPSSLSHDVSFSIIANFSDDSDSDDDSPYADPEDSHAVAQAKKKAIETPEYSYTERDIIL